MTAAEHADRAAAERLDAIEQHIKPCGCAETRDQSDLRWLVEQLRAAWAAAPPACGHAEGEFRWLHCALQTAERERDEARRENERLRETLEAIARRASVGPPPGRDRDGWYTLVVTLAWVAREALAPPGPSARSGAPGEGG